MEGSDPGLMGEENGGGGNKEDERREKRSEHVENKPVKLDFVQALYNFTC